MPRLKETEAQKYQQKHNQIRAYIQYKAIVLGIHHDRLATICRMSRKTLYMRYRDPGKFTLNELECIAGALHIPLMQLLDPEQTDKTA